jgi:hypothetical protein
MYPPLLYFIKNRCDYFHTIIWFFLAFLRPILLPPLERRSSIIYSLSVVTPPSFASAALSSAFVSTFFSSSLAGAAATSSVTPPAAGGASASLTAPPFALSFFFCPSSKFFLNSLASKDVSEGSSSVFPVVSHFSWICHSRPTFTVCKSYSKRLRCGFSLCDIGSNVVHPRSI